jgi:hypothetical protein
MILEIFFPETFGVFYSNYNWLGRKSNHNIGFF